jgi:hypothetical protein
MPIFNNFNQLAHRLIDKNGQSVIWRCFKDLEKSSEPWNPGETEYQFEDKPVKIVFFPSSYRDSKTKGFIRNSEQHKSDYVGFMADNGFAPDLKDVVIRGDKILRILSFELISPNGENLLYEFDFKENLLATSAL